MYQPSLWPVSVKGVALDHEQRVLLLRNEREEWELPGGRLEIGPDGGGSAPADTSAEQAVERELQEETGWIVKADRQLEEGTWIYEPIPGRRVLILTYGCVVLTPDQVPVLSHEHKQIGLFRRHEVAALTMPDGYKHAISAWYDHPQR
ncbi:NUDIX hydrolase [Streptomyces virginiae]|uniref:NUDIX hydrolase n=1 Tax=Streptomyces virginiae TaxID=1961 RepID=UPI00345252DD